MKATRVFREEEEYYAQFYRIEFPSGVIVLVFDNDHQMNSARATDLIAELDL